MIVFTIFPLYVITCAACDQETGNFLLVAAQSGCKGSEARDAGHRHVVPQPQRASLAPRVRLPQRGMTSLRFLMYVSFKQDPDPTVM